MVLSAISFLLNREMKFLLFGVDLLRPQGVVPKLWWNSDLCPSHEAAEGNVVCRAASQEAVLCTRVCVSPPALVAAGMAEYLSREWK